MSWLMYFLYSIATFIIYFLPGYFISKLPFLKFNNRETIMSSFIFSSLLFALIGVIVHLIGIVWSPILFLLLFSFSIILFLYYRFKKIKLFDFNKSLLSLLFLQYSILIILQTFIPLYPLGGDHFSHYESSKIFLNREWTITESMGDRAPLYNFILGFFMAGFNNTNFWIVQLVSTLMNSLIMISAYCVAETVFNKKVALFSALMIILSPLLLETSLYVFPKNFVAFLVLAFYYLLLRGKTNYLLGITAGLAFITHPYSLAFIISGVMVFLFRNFKSNILTFFKFIFIPMILIYLPWAVWNFLELGTPLTSVAMKYYPIAVNGYEHLHEKTSEQIWNEFKAKPFVYNIFVRLVNAFIFLFPLTFIIPKVISLFNPIQITTHKFIDFSTQPWSYNFVQTLAGGMTFLLFFFACVGLWKLFKNKDRTKFLWLTVLPFFFILLAFGWIQPLARVAFSPIVPLFMMIGFNEVLARKSRKRWIMLIFIFALIESIIFSYIYSLNVDWTRQLVTQSGDISRHEQLFTAYKLFRSDYSLLTQT